MPMRYFVFAISFGCLLLGGSADARCHGHYYHGQCYAHRYHGHYYRYRYHGHYYLHRSYRHGHWHYY